MFNKTFATATLCLGLSLGLGLASTSAAAAVHRHMRLSELSLISVPRRSQTSHDVLACVLYDRAQGADTAHAQ